MHKRICEDELQPKEAKEQRTFGLAHAGAGQRPVNADDAHPISRLAAVHQVAAEDDVDAAGEQAGGAPLGHLLDGQSLVVLVAAEAKLGVQGVARVVLGGVGGAGRVAGEAGAVVVALLGVAPGGLAVVGGAEHLRADRTQFGGNAVDGHHLSCDGEDADVCV